MLDIPPVPASAEQVTPPFFADEAERKLVDYGTLKRRMERRFKARVINQQLRRQSDPPIYQLRLVQKDGRVLDVTVNAYTAAVIKVEG
ncbi:MAG: PepSY domain-containing protein [Rhodothalassiaceae bacterium]